MSNKQTVDKKYSKQDLERAFIIGFINRNANIEFVMDDLPNAVKAIPKMIKYIDEINTN